jgi:hypothetical protein
VDGGGGGKHIDEMNDVLDDDTDCPFGEFFFPNTELCFILLLFDFMQGRSMKDSFRNLKAYRLHWRDRWHEYGQARGLKGGLKMHSHMQEEWLLDTGHCCKRCPVWWLEYARQHLFGAPVDIEDMFDEETRCPFGECLFPNTDIYYLVTSRHLCGSCHYAWTQSTIHTKRVNTGPGLSVPDRFPECCPSFDPWDYESSGDDDEDSDDQESRRPTSLPRSVLLFVIVFLSSKTQRNTEHILSWGSRT